MRFAVKSLLALLLVPMIGLAQSPHPILSSLEAYKQPNGVLVRWVIAGGGQCQGTSIFRSLDQTTFEQIGHIDGICGSTDAEETYTYFDSIPHPNTYNHYRLEMGFQGFTTIVTVFFEDFGSSNFSLLTDRPTKTFKVLYSNDLNNRAVLTVYDGMGNSVYRDYSSVSDIEFQTSGWEAGVYIFRVTGVSKADIQGKFYIGNR